MVVKNSNTFRIHNGYGPVEVKRAITDNSFNLQRLEG